MNDTPSPSPQPTSKSGLPQALGAYITWGFLPLYLILVKSVPPFEFVAWRIVWTVPFCLLLVLAMGQVPAIAAALRDRRVVLTLLGSAILIAINWFTYIWAIQTGHVYAASLGYYMNPLINVLLGTFLLGERLSRNQWFAVGLASCGVALLLGGALTTLWISLTLAFSFGTYGLLRKRVAVEALPGLTIESAILLPIAGLIAYYYAETPDGSAFGRELWLSLAIMAGGVLTAVPLLMFAIAARRMKYSTLGFIQYLAPTIVFILGLTVFREELKPVQLACFILIWCALAIFVWEMWSGRRRPAVTRV